MMNVGCASTNIEFELTEMEEIALADAQNLINGNYADVAGKFDDTLSAQLDESALTTAFETTVETIGDYVGNVSYDWEVDREYFVAVITEEYEESLLVIRLSYNENKEISGLFISYGEKAVDTSLGEEMAVKVGADENYLLDGILTLPNNAEKPPVVLLVQGSGPTDKDESVGALTPFADIAHDLAEQGIATLRYDKRFYTYPEQAEELGGDLTLREEVLDDVAAAIDFLAQNENVDTNNIFVLGHSLGGMLSPAIATENEEVKGIISMAGSLRPLYEISYSQVKEVLETQSGVDEQTLELINSQSEQIENEIEILRGDISDIPNDMVLMGLYAGYQKSVKEYAGMNFIENVNLPILVLQGSEDFQVSPEEDYKSWEEAVGDRENAELKLYEGLNHMMVESNGKRDVSEYDVFSKVEEDVITDIAEFVKKWSE